MNARLPPPSARMLPPGLRAGLEAVSAPLLAHDGQHIAFDPQKNPPLCNLFVQFLQRLGADVNAFGSSNGTISGFELA